MSYREENGQVILSMSREDYDIVLVALGYWTSAHVHDSNRRKLFDLVNRLNEGNPKWTPYEIPSPSPRCTPSAPPRSKDGPQK